MQIIPFHSFARVKVPDKSYCSAGYVKPIIYLYFKHLRKPSLLLGNCVVVFIED